MAHIDSTAFCEAAAQTDERAESWTVSYFKLAVVCMAAWRLAALVVQLPGKFIPRGTGLLLAGLAASVAGMIFDEVAKVDVMINSKTGQYNRLNVYFPVNYMCMSFIAYATGAQLVMKNYRGLGRHIIVSAVCVSSSVLIIVFLLTYAVLLSTGARFMRFNALVGSSATSTPEQMDELLAMPGASFAISIMIGGILTSRSPASAISIVTEMRANGPFTKMALGGTCALYVISNIIFPIIRVIAQSMMATVMAEICGAGGKIEIGSSIGSFLFSMFLTALVSLVVGKFLHMIVGLPMRVVLKKHLHIRSPAFELYIKCSLALLVGFATFMLKFMLMSIDAGGTLEIKVEPLLVCLLAAMFVVNHRSQNREAEWKRMCATCAPYIYCIFFALAGASVNFSAVIESQFVGPVMLVCFRLVAIAFGTFIAGLADRPRPRMRVQHVSWMNYITQAGVALSFAQEVLDEPSLPLYMRNYIYTLVVASVFINQLIGPPLFKIALRLSGEAFMDRIGGAQLVVVEGQAPHIEVKTLSWETRAGVGSSHVAQVSRVETSRRVVRKLTPDYLHCQLGDGIVSRNERTGATQKFAFLSMLEDDTENFDACRLMRDVYGVKRTIVHVSDRSRSQKRFDEIGAIIVDEQSLVVGSLDQFLSSAQAAELLLHRDPSCHVICAAVGMEVAGLHINQLKLPRDVQIAKLVRQDADETEAIVPTPFTKVQYEDQLTLCGTPSSIAKVTAIVKGRIKMVNVGGKERRMRRRRGAAAGACSWSAHHGYSSSRRPRISWGSTGSTESLYDNLGIHYRASLSDEEEVIKRPTSRIVPVNASSHGFPSSSPLARRFSSSSTTSSTVSVSSSLSLQGWWCLGRRILRAPWHALRYSPSVTVTAS